jgi:dipeptidyl aminopeptidase/acylaminoacyl peptidase
MAVDEADITYTSGGQKVSARLWLPPTDEGESPGVLLCPGRLREIEGLTFLAEALVARGIVVLGTRYRGMDMRTDDADCIAGLEHLAGLPEVDASRLAMVGHSRGAMASLRIAAQDERVRSVVALQPVTDLGGYVAATRDYSPVRYERLVESLDGSPEEHPETYAELSPIEYADRIRVPVLLVAGTMDLHSPADHSVRMHGALLAAGNADVQLEVLDGMGHFFERMYFGYLHETIVDLTAGWLERSLSERAAVTGESKKKGGNP